MNKYIIVFCEGDHDIAFLIRLLFVEGFTSYEKKVREFPKPLDDLYKTNLANKKIEDIEFKYQKPNQKVPYTVLFKEQTLVIFHNLGGDGNILNGKAQSIEKQYIELNDKARLEIEGYEKLNYRFLYFLDADEEGVATRITQLREKLEASKLQHYELSLKDNYEIGCAIFYKTDDVNTKGKLENILLELMKSENDTIFDSSQTFIEEHKHPELRQKKFICNDMDEKYDGSTNFKEDKSIISIAGQLQFSGSNNSVIIANSDYIKKEDILNNGHCQKIIKLFEPPVDITAEL